MGQMKVDRPEAALEQQGKGELGPKDRGEDANRNRDAEDTRESGAGVRPAAGKPTSGEELPRGGKR